MQDLKDTDNDNDVIDNQFYEEILIKFYRIRNS